MFLMQVWLLKSPKSHNENESRIEWVGKVEVEVQALKAESYLY